MGPKMTDNEILVQLALGTFDPSQLYIIIQDTKNPEVIVAAAHLFAKLDVIRENSSISDGIHADTITNAFMNNIHTPQLVKDYTMIARQIKSLIRKKHYPSLKDPKYLDYDIKLLQTKLKILYPKVFKD